jgi:hypothetical protein
MKTLEHPMNRRHLYPRAQVGVHTLHIPDTEGEDHIAFVEAEVAVIEDAVLVDDEDASAGVVDVDNNEAEWAHAHCNHEIETVVIVAEVEVEPATEIEAVEIVPSFPSRHRTDSPSILTSAPAKTNFLR